MQLKVGEFAKRTGMTVRMLHHFDSIGLLVPSARSESDHRLYDQNDIARLHAIQALRQIGLPLKEIAALLKGKQQPLPTIIQRQITALEYQIAQASELSARLKLLQSNLSQGNEPDLADWLSMLSSMSTFGKYFTASELKRIFESGKQTEHQWVPLIAEIRNAMNRAVSPSALELQPLARRWMDLSVRMMQGDFELMKRWEKMYLQEPTTRGKRGDDLALVQYINTAVDLRVQAFLTYFSQSELQALNVDLEHEWASLGAEISKLMRRKAAIKGEKMQATATKWSNLVDRASNHNPILRRKFINAHAVDPILRAGSILDPTLESFIHEAWLEGGKQ
jgi:DNA-binding transcriptional MerR regulator